MSEVPSARNDTQRVTEGDLNVEVFIRDGEISLIVITPGDHARVTASSLQGLPALVDRISRGEPVSPQFAPRRRGPTLTPKDFDEVARVYVEAKSLRQPVTEAVARARGVSRSRASHLIREAKRDGAFNRIGAPQEGTSSDAQEQ